jgi:hypothetical protein
MKLYAWPAALGERASKLPGFERLVTRDADTKKWICSARTYAELQKVEGFKSAEEVALDEARWDAAGDRLVIGYAALVADPLPETTRDEVQLLLYVQRELRLEYMGRRSLSEDKLPAPKGELFNLDVGGRGRAYLFRIVHTTAGNDARLERIGGLFKEWQGWLNDPGAKLVLSFGGGGFRLFGAISVLKVLDQLLEDRSHVAEIWGSSGGALLGYTYAMGFDPETLEQLGYDLYHDRHPHLTSGTIPSVIKARFNALVRGLRGEPPKAEMAAWLDELDKKQPKAKRRNVRVPFYAMATNPHRDGMTALADPDDIPDSCKDFILPCDARDAVAASTAVPGILAAQKGITGTDDGNDTDTWVDGSILEENPISLPYVKWMRERTQPGAKQRLKILLLSLNVRSSEVGLLKTLQQLPVLNRVHAIRRMARLIDLMLDSKTDGVIRTITESPDVEIFSIKLNLGQLSLNDPGEIPLMIRVGRMVDAWQLTTHRKLM